MHPLTHQLAEAICNNKSLAECSVEEMEAIIKQYPYFASVHLLLAAKNKLENKTNAAQLATASLYFNNPLWLHYFVNKKDVQPIAITAPAPVFEEPVNDELVVANPRHEPAKPETKKDEVVMQVSVVAATTEKEKANLPPLVFDPYHTVDYFASQGIKTILEEKPKDRFGQQLKSFTEWLKTIRQLPPQQIVAATEVVSEEKVVQLATHSIEDRKVETEAMAEVWIKQGHPEKAAAIYQKLSLLNPSKSSYFAILIENLKKN